MQKYISAKALYSQFKKVREDIENGDVYIVLYHSEPVARIMPFEEGQQKKKYSIKDIRKFTFSSKDPDKNWAENYKKYLYKK